MTEEELEKAMKSIRKRQFLGIVIAIIGILIMMVFLTFLKS